MAEPTKYLETSWRKRSDEAQAKVLKAIKELQANGEPVNFCTRMKLYGRRLKARDRWKRRKQDYGTKNMTAHQNRKMCL